MPCVPAHASKSLHWPTVQLKWMKVHAARFVKRDGSSMVTHRAAERLVSWITDRVLSSLFTCGRASGTL